MTFIVTRDTAFDFVAEHMPDRESIQGLEEVTKLANWILLNWGCIEAGDLLAARAEYDAERAEWLVGGQDLDAFLAANEDSAHEDGISRRVVPELLARKVGRLRQSKEGEAVLELMLEAVRMAQPAAVLWGNVPDDQFELISNFFVSVQPHIARVPSYLLDRYQTAWRELRQSEMSDAMPASIERTLRSKRLGDSMQSAAADNFIRMLADSEHEGYIDRMQTELMMRRQIPQSPSPASPMPVRRRSRDV